MLYHCHVELDVHFDFQVPGLDTDQTGGHVRPLREELNASVQEKLFGCHTGTLNWSIQYRSTSKFQLKEPSTLPDLQSQFRSELMCLGCAGSTQAATGRDIAPRCHSMISLLPRNQDRDLAVLKDRTRMGEVM